VPAEQPRRVAWLAGYAVVTPLAFPHPLGGGVLDLGLVCAWLSPACLLLGLRGLAPARAARWGFLAALLAHSAILHWIWIVSVVYGHAHPLLGLLGPVGLGAYIALFTAAFAALAARWGRAGLASPVALAALWAALDHLRSFALSGFPWAELGYAQHRNAWLLPVVAYTGVYGLGFVSALGGAGLARAWVDWRARGRPGPAALAALAGVALAHAAGALLAARAPDDPPERVRVAVLQGNIDQGVKWSGDWYEHTFGIYEELTRHAAARGAELVVWPETAVPGAVVAEGRDVERLSALARETGTLLVVGAVGLEPGARGAPPRVYDSAFIVDADGRLSDRYDKSHLVPFGEYVPFRDWIGSFFQAVARGIADTGVTAGPEPRALSLSLPDGTRLTAGVPICYELIFPNLTRRFVQEGAEMLFAITNDAWYGRTGAPFQFLAITAVRSAENRVWTARAANTGVSAIIDAGGRVRERTRIFEPGLLVADVPPRPAPLGGSFYARHGDVFAAGCWLVVAAL